MNGNDPIGCGLGAGRASELLMLVCEYEQRSAYSNTDLLGEEKVAFGDSDNEMRFATTTRNRNPMDTRPAACRLSTCPNLLNLPEPTRHHLSFAPPPFYAMNDQWFVSL